MSSDRPLEFFLDRSLGKSTAERLRHAGCVVHRIADFYDDDAQSVDDETWIAEGCARGWVLLTKDRHIRYRAAELGSLDGQMFCWAHGNAMVDETVDGLIEAMPAIRRTVAKYEIGFWLVYRDGRVRRTWP